VRHGKLAFEHYFRGFDLKARDGPDIIDFNTTTTHDLRSMTKSVTALVLGAAIDRGIITDVDQSVLSFFPDSGATMDRPALQQLLADLTAGRVDTVVVYKIDRLTRSLADFAKIVEILDARDASFVSVTQQFNTTTSMGRLTLNVLLSFAQFERKVIGERVRDKIAASNARLSQGAGVPFAISRRISPRRSSMGGSHPI
jgi:hypothetical protein